MDDVDRDAGYTAFQYCPYCQRVVAQATGRIGADDGYLDCAECGEPIMSPVYVKAARPSEATPEAGTVWRT